MVGLVGVQTDFGSADRRAVLRSTWFPPDPDGLVRLEVVDLVIRMYSWFSPIQWLISAYMT